MSGLDLKYFSKILRRAKAPLNTLLIGAYIFFFIETNIDINIHFSSFNKSLFKKKLQFM